MPVIGSSSRCELAKKCGKSNCYWNQLARGFIPFTSAGMTPEQINEVLLHNSQFEKYEIPNLRIEFGSSINYIVCDDFMET